MQEQHAQTTASQAVPGFINVYLGTSSCDPNEGATRSCGCEYGVRMNKDIADIASSSIAG